MSTFVVGGSGIVSIMKDVSRRKDQDKRGDVFY